MSDPIFERYKDVLKAGHVAALRGRLEEALEHYAEAARIADERPLPHTSAGSVLLRLGRAEEAVAAYERALDRAPDDDAALAGRAEALLAARRSDGMAAAADLPPGAASAPGDVTPRPASTSAELDAAPADAPAEEPPGGDAARAPERAPPDPARHLAAAESLLVGGDRAAAALELIEAADGYVALDLLDAALDAAGQALRVAPDLPAVHLALARLYFRRGWRERATDTLLLLGRFLEIEDDADARAATAALARQHRGADPRLAELDREPRGGATPAGG